MTRRLQARLRDDLDEPLQKLCGLIRDDRSYRAVRNFALEFADRYTAPEGERLDGERFLLSPRWKETWKPDYPTAERQLTWGLFFPNGHDDESESLYRVFTEIARYVRSR